MRRLAVFFGLLATIVVVPATDAFGGGGGCHSGRQETSGTTVDMADICFTQTVVHVAPGDTVTWTNHDEMEHTVTGVGGEWGDYEPIFEGQTRSSRFDDVGVYPYFCIIHPGMVGAVVVDGGNSDEVAAAVPISAVSDDGTSALAWWVGGGLVFLLLVAGGIYLLERMRSALPRG